MARNDQTFKFRHSGEKHFAAFNAKSTQEYLLKWGLKDGMSMDMFWYDSFFQDYNKDKFVMDFFKDNIVQSNLKVPSTRGGWTSLGDIRPSRVEVDVIPASITNMEFFDRIYKDGLVRTSGSICKCYDEQFGEFLISDELRKMVVTDESDFWELFSDKEREEFIFRIFKHICIGGHVCQYEDEVSPYLETAKFLYKDLVSVHKDKDTKTLAVSSIVLKATVWADDKVVFPGDAVHEQSFAYFAINPIKRHVILWSHSWR